MLDIITTNVLTVDALRAELLSLLRWTITGIDMLALFERLIRSEGDATQ